jgi:BirA family biotin operon repressor/biotin-[acetyl-CoA-carboxylase] ligase
MNFEKIKIEAEENFFQTFRRSAIGSRLIFSKQTASTNLYALENHNKLSSGTVILSYEQTSGRGRKGRTWSSPPGLGLYMTILLKDQYLSQKTMIVNLLASISAYDAVKEEISDEKIKEGINLELKWPNDIMLNFKKLGGVLSERQGSSTDIGTIAIGIGININHSETDFPEDLIKKAVSLKIIDNKNRQPWQFALKVTDHFNRWLLKLSQNGSRALIDKWCEHSPISKGARVRIISDDEEYIAVTEGLDSDGFLKVKRYGDRLQRILSADIVTLRRD